MKKILYGLSLVLLSFFLASCGSSNSETGVSLVKFDEENYNRKTECSSVKLVIKLKNKNNYLINSIKVNGENVTVEEITENEFDKFGFFVVLTEGQNDFVIDEITYKTSENELKMVELDNTLKRFSIKRVFPDEQNLINVELFTVTNINKKFKYGDEINFEVVLDNDSELVINYFKLNGELVTDFEETEKNTFIFSCNLTNVNTTKFSLTEIGYKESVDSIGFETINLGKVVFVTIETELELELLKFGTTTNFENRALKINDRLVVEKNEDSLKELTLDLCLTIKNANNELIEKIILEINDEEYEIQINQNGTNIDFSVSLFKGSEDLIGLYKVDIKFIGFKTEKESIHFESENTIKIDFYDGVINNSEDFSKINSNLEGAYFIADNFSYTSGVGKECIVPGVFNGLIEGNGKKIDFDECLLNNPIFFELGKNSNIKNITFTNCSLSTKQETTSLFAKTNKGSITNVSLTGTEIKTAETKDVSNFVETNEGTINNVYITTQNIELDPCTYSAIALTNTKSGIISKVVVKSWGEYSLKLKGETGNYTIYNFVKDNFSKDVDALLSFVDYTSVSFTDRLYDMEDEDDYKTVMEKEKILIIAELSEEMKEKNCLNFVELESKNENGSLKEYLLGIKFNENNLYWNLDGRYPYLK